VYHASNLVELLPTSLTESVGKVRKRGFSAILLCVKSNQSKEQYHETKEQSRSLCSRIQDEQRNPWLSKAWQSDRYARPLHNRSQGSKETQRQTRLKEQALGRSNKPQTARPFVNHMVKRLRGFGRTSTITTTSPQHVAVNPLKYPFLPIVYLLTVGCAHHDGHKPLYYIALSTWQPTYIYIKEI
jgi:hypothetical protein